MKKYILYLILSIFLISFVTADLSDDIIVYYTMDNADLDGTNVYDVSNNGHNGTLSGNYTTGHIGVLNEAIGVADTDGQIQVAGDLTFDDDYTLCMTFNKSLAGTEGYSRWFRFEHADNPYIRMIEYGANKGDKIQFLTKDDLVSGSTECIYEDSTRSHLSDNTYHTLCILKNNSASGNCNTQFSFWLDGSSFSGFSSSNTGDVDSLSTSAATQFLMNNNGNSEGFDGQMDNFILWDRALTATELATYYNSGNLCDPVDNPSGCVSLPELNLYSNLTNITNYNLTDIRFWYNGSLSNQNNDLYNCTFYIDTNLVLTNEVNITVTQYFNYTFDYVDDTDYKINITCLNDEANDTLYYNINVDNKPHVYLFTNLINNTDNYNDDLFITYNGTIDENWQTDIFTCDLYVDGVYNQVDSNVNLSILQNFTYSFGTVSDDFEFEINCSNSETENNTGGYIYSVDTTPVYYETNRVNNSIHILNELNTFYFNFTDDNLDGYEINRTNEDNGSVISHIWAEGITTTFAENLTSYNETVLGNFSTTVTMWDSHTGEILKVIPTKEDNIIDNKIIYEGLEFYCDNTKTMDMLLDEQDKIKPVITFTETKDYQTCYYVLKEPRFIPKEVSGYNNHYVDRVLNIWVDEVDVLHKSEQIGNVIKITYDMTNEKETKDTLITNSFGDLNVKTVIYEYTVINRTIPIIEDVRLDYNVPYDNETLYGYCNASHMDNLNLTYYWQILKNDVIQNYSTLYNVTQGIERNVFNISSTITSINETWKLRCKAFDGTTNTSWYMTSVTIQPYSISIDDYTPLTTTFSIDEYTNYTFSVDTITGGFGDYTFQWFLDSILQAITQAWTYVGSIGDYGVKTITVFVNDTFGTGAQNVTWVVNVSQLYFPPTNVSTLTPTKGNMDYTIPVQCSGSKPQTEYDSLVRYRVEYNINGGSWNLLFDNLAGWGQFDLSNVDYGDEVDFRCMPYSNYLNGSWFNPVGNITRAKQLTLYLYDPSPLNYYIHNQEYQLGIVADTEIYNNISISEAYVDCNGDYLWDYYWNYTDINYIREHFTCVNYYGNVPHVIGITLLKDDGTNWNIKACDTTRQENECRIQKTYELRVI